MSAELDTKSQVLQMIQRKHPEYHPLLELAKIGLDEGTDVRLRVDCHKTIVRYCEPELKSVEVKGKIDGDFGMLRVVIDKGDGGTSTFGDMLAGEDETVG